MSGHSTNLDEVMDHPAVHRLSLRVVTLGCLIILLDGFDTQAIGFAAAAMSHSLTIELSHFGVIFSIGLVGALLGALILSPLADRFGRKPVIELTVAVFGVFTLLTPFASTMGELCVLRFLAGVGLGGAIPNVISHCVEYVPLRRRGLVVGMLYAGFPVGGMLGAALAAVIIPAFGWESMFVIGGVLPFIAVACFHVLAPESLVYLSGAQEREHRLKALMKKILPDGESLTLQAEPQRASKPKLREVFSHGGFQGSMLIWIAFFMVLLLLIVMVLWTPGLLQEAGLEPSQSMLIVGLINLGSALGNVWIGRSIDQRGPFTIIPIVVMLGAVCLMPMGLLIGVPGILSICAVGSGFFFGAAASGMLTLSALWYPAKVRATGLGFAYSMGRLGQVIGPLVTGGLLTLGMSVQEIFYLAAVPAGCAIASILILRRLPHAKRLSTEQLSPVLTH